MAIEDSDAYEAFTGTASEPSWTSTLSEARSLFPDEETADMQTMTFIPAVGRYVLMFNTDAKHTGRFAVYETPRPWGPWTEIAHYDGSWCAWGESLSGYMLQRWLAPKWLGPLSDGAVRFRMTWSASDRWDRFNLVSGTFEVE